MQVRAFFRCLVRECSDDRITDVAAMMTYYAVFALFPMIVFVVTMALLVTPSDVIDSSVGYATATMPADVASLIVEQVARLESAADAGFAIGGAVLALWGASRGAASLASALNDMFDKRETRPWWKRQLIAIAATLAVAVILVVAMSLLAAGPVAGIGWTMARWAVAAVLIMVVWALLYKLLPDTDAPFRIFTPGAVVGVLLWFGVTRAFAVYLDRFAGYQKMYGAVATVIVFLTWLWLSNIALLLGAEINDVLADFRKDRSPAAAALARQEVPAR